MMAKKKTVSLPPNAELEQIAISKIRDTEAPVTAKQLAGIVSASIKIPELILTSILDDAVSKGLLYPFPPATAKGKARYWSRDFVDFGCYLIIQSIQKKGPQPKTKLKSAAKGLNDEQFQLALKKLIDSQQVREHPPLGKSKSAPYGIHPPAPEPYMKDLGNQFGKVVEQLIAAGVDRRDLTDVVETWFAKAGITLAPKTSLPSDQATTEVREIDLLILVRQIEPGADRGALVTARELRRAANLDKLQFDQSVLGLARQGKLMLHRHDHASGLTTSERDELVTDGAGTYYVGMALRRVDG
jgi:hypothetical protein